MSALLTAQEHRVVEAIRRKLQDRGMEMHHCSDGAHLVGVVTARGFHQFQHANLAAVAAWVDRDLPGSIRPEHPSGVLTPGEINAKFDRLEKRAGRFEATLRRSFDGGTHQFAAFRFGRCLMGPCSLSALEAFADREFPERGSA